MSKAVCVACHHAIDDAARLCPYCGADPRTGAKIDTQAILNQVFHPRQLTTAEGVLQYARQRQGTVIALAVIVGILLLAGFHQFVLHRNATAVSDASAIPLTDVADLSNQSEDSRPLPMPKLDFQHDGQPQTLRTFIVEPGAVAPQSGAPASVGGQPAKAGAPQR